MRKRKKEMEKTESGDAGKSDLVAQIKKTASGLYYTSETDAEIAAFAGGKAEAVTAEELSRQIQSTGNQPIEEKDFNEFFARLTEIQDWFGDEEKATAQKFADLKNLLEQNLKDVKVFRVGKIQIDIYVVGLDAQGNLTGIQTKAVET